MTAAPSASVTHPAHYTAAFRTVLRYVIVMVVVGLLAGISFQESVKKLDFADVSRGLHIEARIHLALVHGHVFVTSVLLPLALVGALHFALRVGARPLSRRGIRWLTWGVLPASAGTVALMLYKGYHFLLNVRWGATNLAAVDASYFGGVHVLRYGVYGAVHAALGVSLVVFLALLWRSLRPRAGEASA